MVNFWLSILNGKQSKLSFQTNMYMYKSHHNYKWPNYIQSILSNCGMNFIWLQQFRSVPKNIAKKVKNRLLDQNLQVWTAELQSSYKGKHFALFKDNVGCESYITKLNGASLLNMLKFRTCNHRFPRGNRPLGKYCPENRKCELCPKNDIGDNFHYLLTCPFFKPQRKKFIDSYFYARPNVVKYKELLNITSEPKLKKLSSFMKNLMSHFNSN